MRKLLIETDYNISSPSYDDDIPEETSKGCAGTDHPWYRKGDFYLSASFDDEDAHPFAYFPGDPKTGALEFFISDDYFYDDYDDSAIVHNDLFGEALTQYIDKFIRQTFGPVEYKICDKIIDFYNFAQDNGLEPGGAVLGYHSVLVFQKEDGSNRVVFKDIVSKIFNELGINIHVSESLVRMIYNVFDSADWDLGSFCNDFIDELFEYRDMRDMSDQQSVADLLDLSADDLFNDGRLEGRIWTDKGIITFYPGQQPSRDEMRQVIEDISKHLGISEEELLKYYTIFETGSKEAYTGTGYRIHPDATINCCTVADYIEGKYSGFNRKEEIEMVKNRKGAARNIHLANQKDKFNFFKNFRKTRDNAVYVPREKGAGTLAAYHAMRYPFSESRMITELEGPSNSTNYNYSSLSDDYGTQTDYDYSDDYSYSNDFEAGTDFPLFYDEKRGKEFGGDWHSPEAFPFAYFEVAPGQLEFFIGEGCSTHSHLAFNVAKDYYLPNETSDKLMELAKSVVVEINKLIEPAINGDKEKYNWLRNNLDEASNIVSNSSLINNYDIDDDALITIKSDIKSDIRISLLNNSLRGQNDVKHLKHELYRNILKNCCEVNDDDVRVWWLDPLFKFTDLRDGDEYFENGRMEGRIFTHENAKTISFYDEQQPNSEELDKIIKNLVEKTGISYDEFMEYEIIYRNWDETYEDEDGYDMGRVTGCSVYEYITGKPMDEFINPEERKGSQFIPHLASPEEKFNFFKGFRDARDKAIYAPREKAAGTLAAYHAMRYPYGEVRDITGKLLTEERYNQAGTDFPCFYDEKNDEWYEARWDCNYGFPFGYWPIDDAGNEEFFCANPYDTHAQACGLGAEKYFYSRLEDIVGELADDIMTYFMAMVDYFKDYEFYYDEINDEYISEELNETKSVGDWVDMIMDNIYSSFDDTYDYVLQLVTDWLEDDITPTSEDIKDDIINHIEGNYHFDTRDEIDEALEVVGSDFDSYFESGHSEGRIWPHDEMIGFYETEQPNPESLKCILYDLSDYMGKPFEYFMNFFIIFEDPRNNWEVTGCTIENYLSGNYGPDTDEDDDEEEIQYARDGKTVFVPHLASPEEKFDYFKAFRDTRDKAVYAPREKGAGEEGGHTLAAYHAMRYPYGESRNIKGKLIKEDYARDNEAGTDSPYYSDPDTGFVIEGDYDDNDACSFAYFPYKLGSDELKFICCMDADGPLHRDLLMSIMSDIVYGIVNDLTDKEDDIIACLKEYKYNIPNKDDFRDILADIFEEVGVNFNPTHEFANHLYKYLSMSNWSDDVLGYGLFKNLCNEIDDYWSMRSDEPEANVAMAFGVDYGEMLYAGRLEGRIWTDKGLITFYPGQQPSRDEMKYVLKDISENIGIDYNDLLNFYTIFETGSKAPYTGTGYRIHDDATIQCCTVADYIEGRYSGFNRQDEFEMVKNRKGVENLNIHLAKPEEKFNFFKGFRDARDKAIYVPREKGAGSLAAYHAMRYPYSEERKRFLQMIDEEVDLLLEGNGTRCKRQTIALIANRFGLDTDSPYAIDMEHEFKTMFFHHGLDSDRYIVFEPNLCMCALDLGFGTNDFTEEDKEYIENIFNLIYRHIEIINDVKARQAELKVIKDSITGIDALRTLGERLQAEFPVNNEQPVEDVEKSMEGGDEEEEIKLKNGYTLIKDADFKTANKYGNESSPKRKLCFSQIMSTWNDTYSKNGRNTCYILLRDGWENIKPEHDGSEKNCCLGEPFNEKNAYDEYGMSMIFIFVNPQGNLAFANGRWNHDAEWPAGYRCDQEYTQKDIERLVGQPFKKVFKSKYNFGAILAKSLEKLKNGVPVEKAFDGARKVYDKNYENEYYVNIAGLSNIFYNGRIVSPIWFDTIKSPFNSIGLAVGKVGNVNYIFDTNGNRHKFSEISQFINNKLAKGDDISDLVCKESDIDGIKFIKVFDNYNMVSERLNKVVFPNIWFSDISTYYGMILGRYKGVQYYLTEDGKIITREKSFQNILDNIQNYPQLRYKKYDVNPNSYCVLIAGKNYYIRKSDNSILFGGGFTNIRKQNNDRFVWLYDTTTNQYCVGDFEEERLMSQNEFFDYICKLAENGVVYFDKIVDAGEGFKKVYLSNKGWNYMKNGSIIFKDKTMWFDSCGNFKNGIATVRKTALYLVNSNGEFITEDGYSDISIFGKYALCENEEENEEWNEYNDREEDAYNYYLTLIDLTTGQKIYDRKKLAESGSLSSTKFGWEYMTDDDEFSLVVTKDNQIMEEMDYAKLITEDYKRNKDLSVFRSNEDMGYGYKKVNASYNLFNILDKEGNLVLDNWAWWIHDFKDGMLRINTVADENFYLDENLKPMIPFNNIYNKHCDDFHNGYAIVRRADDNRYYIIDKNGNPAFNKKGYEWAINWSHREQIEVKFDNGERYYLDTSNGHLEPINR